jgi:anthranilate synthase/aminodeoxychorismate synthase-like glutamine amidotransferase
MLLLLDNYDSFTYNIYQYLAELNADVLVVRNDKITVEEVVALNPDKIVISPGPNDPARAGISNDVILRFGGSIPILGICLGHQCIGYAFGSTVSRTSEIMHGKTSAIYHDGKGIFHSMPNPFNAIRYHSLAIEEQTIPATLEVTARTQDGVVMGVRHRSLAVEGIQFHPESIMTESGKTLLQNFLNTVI